MSQEKLRHEQKEGTQKKNEAQIFSLRKNI